MAPLESEAGLPGPRVRVAAVIPYKGGLVLVRHRRDCRTYHLLPGGGVDAGETLADALRREVLEETGLAIEPERPLFVSDTIAPDGTRNVVHLTFLARVVGGTPTGSPADARVEGVEVVDASALADLDLRPPMAEQLAEAADRGFRDGARYLGPLWRDET